MKLITVLFSSLLLAQSSARAAVGCDSNLLLVQTLSPAAGSTVNIGEPVTIQVEAVDACGTALTTGVVTARVSNRDPLVPLNHVGNGIWRTTWVPFNSAQPAVSMNVVAVFAQGSVLQSGKADSVVQVAPNSQPPKLAIGVNRIALNSQQGPNPVSRTFGLTNVGGGSLRYTASVRTLSGGGWLSLSPPIGDIPSVVTQSISVTANPASLPEGVYAGLVTIAAAGSNVEIPVSLSVARSQSSLLVSPSGLTFTAVEGGGSPAPQSVSILNQGSGEMPFEARATTLSGSAWLRLSGSSGRLILPLQDVAAVEVIPDTTRLTQGDYYAEIRITSPGVINSPQLLTVLLKVLPRGSNPGADIRPTSLIFIGSPGTSTPAQEIRLTNLVPRSITFNAGFIARDSARWISALPAAATVIPPAASHRLTVRPDFAGLAPGVRSGTISFAFDDGTIRNVNVVSILSPTSPSAAKAANRAAAGCSKTSLRGEFLSLPEGGAIAVGQPAFIQVKVVDECGNLLLGNEKNANSSVFLKFSNADPELYLTPVGDGVWSGMWRPLNNGGGTVIVTAVSLFVQGTLLQAGKTERSVQVGTSPNIPIVQQGSLVHSASFKGDSPVAPGTLITLYGSDLAGSSVVTGSPLPFDVDGTQVLLAGQPLPILYGSANQINAQIPYSLSVNTSHQIVVRRSATLSVPESFTIAAAQPGIFTINQQGTGQGVVMGPDQITVALPAAPAVRGQAIVIYCTGLGEVNPSAPLGVPASASPLARTINTVTVQVGGRSAQVLFSGLTPGFTGLYQVNALVPLDTPIGDSVSLNISAVGQTSNNVTIAVR